MSVLKSDLDYVVFYASKLKEDKRYFVQHKNLIEGQMKSGLELVQKRFGGVDFKKNARAYLKRIGLL